jgi:hypothetical protein
MARPHAAAGLASVSSQIRQLVRMMRTVVMGADWHTRWGIAIVSSVIRNDLRRSVHLVVQDDDAYSCDRANAPIIQDRNGLSYCAIQMPECQTPEDGSESSRDLFGATAGGPCLISP